MVVAADLYRPVTRIDRTQGRGRSAAIELDIAVRREYLARCRHDGKRQFARPDGLVHGDQLGAVREGAFHLQHGQQVGDAWHHIIGIENGRAEPDQLGNTSAFACAFKNLVGNQGRGFREIQAQALAAAFA